MKFDDNVGLNTNENEKNDEDDDEMFHEIWIRKEKNSVYLIQ